MGPASKASAPKAAAKPAGKKRSGLSPEKQALAGELGKMRGQMRAQNQASPNQRIRNALTKDAVAYAKGNLAAKAGKPKAANKVSASPRRLSKAEQDYADIRSQKSKFRSDKAVRAEMQRRGHLKGKDPQGELIGIAANARGKKAVGPQVTRMNKPPAAAPASSKPARKTNSARAADLKAKGTTAIGGRVKAKGFAGGKGAQERAGGLRNQKRITYTGKGSGPRTSASMGTVGVSPRQVARVRAKSQQAAAQDPAPKIKTSGRVSASKMREPMGTSNPRGTIAAGSFNTRSSVNKRIRPSDSTNASGRERRQVARTMGNALSGAKRKGKK
jgi:hypothetical protein